MEPLSVISFTFSQVFSCFSSHLTLCVDQHALLFHMPGAGSPTGHLSSGTQEIKWWSHSKFPVGRELSVLILHNYPLWVRGYVIPT